MHSSSSPKSETADILARDSQYLLPVYARYQVVMERGEGVYVYDTDGNRYLDLMAGLGVNGLGHAHARMVKAMAEQAAKMVHLSPQYSSKASVDLAQRLCELSGLSSVFYSTGGSEAVEGALKLARAYGHKNFGAHKHRVIALNGSYHGRTYGSLSVTGQSKYRSDFEPGLPGIDFVDREDLAQLEAAVSGDACCILLEPILGEGGVHELSHEYLKRARDLANRHSALLIFDEIQCGLGRAGDWFAYQASGVRPDALILGKPLGGGLPLSALVVDRDLVNTLGVAKHGSTLGGSPMACRMGVEFLSVMEDDNLLAQIRETGAVLKRELEKLAATSPIAVEARGRGLIQALELNVPGRPIVEAGLKEGLMLNVVQGHILRFLPSFLLTPEHVMEAIPVITRLLEQEAAKHPASVATTSTAR
ncbi:MAG: acetylornithine transaminase [Acidobacteria bacterium]|nr:acetylornithine transaminase [Acidobacteriota bacterium]